MRDEFLLNLEKVFIQKRERQEEIISFSLEGEDFSFERIAENLFRNLNTQEVFCGHWDNIRKMGLTAELEYEVKRPELSSGESEERSDDKILSPMPGKILKVEVAQGQKVKKGETLIIVEAMKMEHRLKASCDGVVEKILYAEGDQVQGKAELIVFAKDQA